MHKTCANKKRKMCRCIQEKKRGLEDCCLHVAVTYCCGEEVPRGVTARATDDRSSGDFRGEIWGCFVGSCPGWSPARRQYDNTTSYRGSTAEVP